MRVFPTGPGRPSAPCDDRKCGDDVVRGRYTGKLLPRLIMPDGCHAFIAPYSAGAAWCARKAERGAAMIREKRRGNGSARRGAGIRYVQQ